MQHAASNRRVTSGAANALDGRAQSRVSEIVGVMQQQYEIAPRPVQQSGDSQSVGHFPPRNLLGVGCSEGSITAALGAGLSLSAAQTHGCDVRELSNVAGFTFKVTDGSTLPYESNSFDCCLALMSLHHIEDVGQTLREIHRVLRPGGMLVLLLHDLTLTQPHLSVVIGESSNCFDVCSREWLCVCDSTFCHSSLTLSFLVLFVDSLCREDVQHLMYARTWSQPPEQDNFCQDYWAHTRVRREWTSILTRHHFMQSERSPDTDRVYRAPLQPLRWRTGQHIKNPFQFYYAAYFKPHAAASAALLPN